MPIASRYERNFSSFSTFLFITSKRMRARETLMRTMERNCEIERRIFFLNKMLAVVDQWQHAPQQNKTHWKFVVFYFPKISVLWTSIKPYRAHCTHSKSDHKNVYDFFVVVCLFIIFDTNTWNALFHSDINLNLK